MITEIENQLPNCWTEGAPKEEGLFLLRFDSCGNPWYFLYECRVDPSDKYERMLFLDHKGGNYIHDYTTTLKGRLTHHCKATTENFGFILNSLAPHRFNKELMKYERIE